jgi:hypothetical protein
MVLIDWVSKKQTTIETSVCGAKFVAMKHIIEKLQELCYKLCMMGIPLTGPSFIYADDKLQVINSTQPELTLKKKCNSICYHTVQESVAMGEFSITHIRTGANLSDLMTKVTHGGKRRQLVENILYNTYDDHPRHASSHQKNTVRTMVAHGAPCLCIELCWVTKILASRKCEIGYSQFCLISIYLSLG